LSNIREVLAKNNIKYETFLVWVDLIEEMQAVVPPQRDMTLGELFAKWMIEIEIEYGQK
jgi:hypothetical protein